MNISMTAARTPAEHRNSFDLLRLFACLLVVFGHAHALTGEIGPGFAGNSVQTIGLKIFFVISGYLVSASWLADPDIARFLLRRCLRIFPALTVVVFLSALIGGPALSTLPVEEYFRHPFTWYYFSNAGMYIRYNLPGVFSSNIYPHAVNGSLWSLPVEFVMYLVTPAIIVLTRARISKTGHWLYIGATVLVSSASLLVMRGGAPPSAAVIYGTNVWYILELAPFFLIGGAYAVLRLESSLSLSVALIAVLALATFPLRPLLQEAALYLVLPYACLALGMSVTSGATLVVRFGDLSYGLFLYSFPVQQSLVHIGGATGGASLNFVLGTFIAGIFSVVSWHFVERPALSFKPMRPVGSTCEHGPSIQNS